jgi:predicted alternative tryptophan synthase beta-subunit
MPRDRLELMGDERCERRVIIRFRYRNRLRTLKVTAARRTMSAEASESSYTHVARHVLRQDSGHPGSIGAIAS